MYKGGISLGEVKARPGCVWIIDRLNKYSLLFLQFPTTNMFHIFMSAEPQFTCTVEIQTDIYSSCKIKKYNSFSVAKWTKDVEILHACCQKLQGSEHKWVSSVFIEYFGIFALMRWPSTRWTNTTVNCLA